MRFPTILVLLICLPWQLSAQERSRWYADLGLGVVIADNQSLGPPGAEAGFDLGTPVGSLALGRYFGPRWRAEFEAAYRDNDLESLFWPDSGRSILIAASDGVRVLSFNLNAVRSFRLGAFRPYLGAGVGYGRLRYRMSEDATIWPARAPRRPILDDKADVIAVQAVAGFELPLGDRLGLAFDYRLWHAPDVDLTYATGDRHSLSHTTHSALAHLTFRLGGQGTPPEIPTLFQTSGGWYLRSRVGIGFPLDSETRHSNTNLDAFRTGPALGVALGRQLGQYWRVELALDWQKNRVEVVDFGDPWGQIPSEGRVNSLSVMVEAAYRFRPASAVRPYLGVGFGASAFDYRVRLADALPAYSAPPSGTPPYQPGELFLDDDAWAPTAALFAGLEFDLSEQLSLHTEVRTTYSAPIELERPDGSPFDTWHWVHGVRASLIWAL